MHVPNERIPVRATRDGRVMSVDAIALGELARAAIAGHGSSAGIIVRARVGDAVRAGDVLAELAGAGDDVAAIGAAFTVADRVAPHRPLLHGMRAGCRSRGPGESWGMTGKWTGAHDRDRRCRLDRERAGVGAQPPRG